MSQQPVVIIGAGITGLSTAYALQQQQIPYVLLESATHSGGALASMHINGFELDAGANTIAASPETQAYLSSLGLDNEILHAAAASKKRFLVRNNQLHAVSPNPVKILGSAYLSGGSKWKLFTERFRKSVPVKEEETVTDFVTRRFNKEIAEYVFDPVLSGIYAGNPDLMSIAEVMPALPRWEKEFGSVTKGLMKDRTAMAGRKIISLKGGTQQLTNRLESLLESKVHYGCVVKNITSASGGYQVEYMENGVSAVLQADRVVITTPAYQTAQMINLLDGNIAGLLQRITYPRMGVLHLGFDAGALQQPLEGFGFLVPNAERMHFLGAICNSAIFRGKAPEGKMLLTVFVGGARQEHYFDEMGQEALQQQVIREIQSLLQLSAAPVMQHFSYVEKAIPQLNIGHAALRRSVAAFNEKYPGLHIHGNYLLGVAIPAIIKHAGEFAASLKKN
ncbi:MAG TPA: protoporphyrinogen oxidase [Chitinophaga sp.]|uniref:protoporphyrinogen oxidase n=1 Tax=Chitinophaga sp. TaxID=1869181 RepID=UPI002C2E17B3|nr:protoporphyrinogen oxidase [Chitinophaga sp.]HVI48797.1 protoporphyrinogen oxidase [Chitinophaga sp.]